MSDRPTPETKRLYPLAIYGVPFDTFNPHNYRVWQAFKVLKGHLERFERERDEAREKPVLAAREFAACGKACGMQPVETILGSVLRVVKERDELLQRIALTVSLLKSCRQNSTGMKMDAYDDLQGAINELES
jgi:hypothetical protein